MQNVPLADPSRFVLQNSAEFVERSRNVLTSGRYVLGEYVRRFEQEFASYVGVDECISVANGTDALELALKAVGVRGGEVIVAPNAGGYGTIAAVSAGATPRWVDIDETTLLMDLESVIGVLVDRTRAVVVTHLYGLAFDISELRLRLQQCGRSDVVIIEDCAQSHGATVDGKRVGSLGDVGCFSFYPTKNLGAVGDGGAITTSNSDIGDRVRTLRQYGWSERYIQTLPGGRNSRLDELQAAFVLFGLESLDRRNELRKKVIQRYLAAGIPVVQGQYAVSERYVGHLAVCRHDQRDVALAKLQESGVMAAIHYPVLDQDFPAFVKLDRSDTPIARRCVKDIFTLPCFPELSDAEIDYVIDVYRSKIRV